MSSPITLRTASLADSAAITNLINAAFEVERYFLERDRIGMEEVRERFETGSFIVAEDGGDLAGCIYVELRGERAYLGLLSIAPQRQRAGLGTLLTSAAEDFCRANGCRVADLLIVNLRQELPAFYRRLGYIENGTAPFPAEGHPKIPCHFVRMSKPLDDSGASGPPHANQN
jgi:predicted N-acetyltransferase YhbS